MTGITTGITIAAVMMVMGYCMRSAARQPPRVDVTGSGFVLEYNRFLRGLAVFFCLGMPGLFLVLIFFVPLKDGGDAIAFLFLLALFLGLGIPLWLETFRVRIAVSEEGIRGASPWRAERFIPWEDVQEVSYSGVNMWFVVTGANRERIRVHLWLTGIGAFAERLRQRVPPEACTKAQPGFDLIRQVGG